jgi:hypothetical protein
MLTPARVLAARPIPPIEGQPSLFDTTEDATPVNSGAALLATMASLPGTDILATGKQCESCRIVLKSGESVTRQSVSPFGASRYVHTTCPTTEISSTTDPESRQS